jgi:hypothetical protein
LIGSPPVARSCDLSPRVTVRTRESPVLGD